jgi:hypothetical protein
VNKSQGLTASAIVLTGVLLRPALTNNSTSTQPTATPARPIATVPFKQATADGPWKASCSYWKPGRWTEDTNGKGLTVPESANLDVHVTEQGTAFASRITGSLEEIDAQCDSDGWGIPALPDVKAKTKIHPHITAFIATVPDPIHSSLALEFDRTIDVLMQAAEENGYVGSYYWLPWKHPIDAIKSTQPTSDAEITENIKREKQPGLIIFKGKDAVPRPPGLAFPSDRVIYLFLVGQTPALGVNGEQLQHALHYEADLRRDHGAELSFKHPESEADIIGPLNSGSAASLRAGLDSAQFARKSSKSSKISKISVAGTSSLTTAAAILNGAAVREPSKETPEPKQIEYLSFGENSRFEADKVFSNFNHAGSRIAFLSEVGTVFGKEIACDTQQEQSTKAATQENQSPAPAPAPCPKNPENGNSKGSRDSSGPFAIRFPREISLFRNAQKEDSSQSATTAEIAASPYLHLSFKDASAGDSIAPFSTALTPFSQEAQWMAIVRELKRRRVDVVGISASNALDELFLAKLLHRDLPDAQLVFFDSSDLMFVRYSDNAPYLGSVAFTAYPLTALSRADTPQTLYNFANASTESLYNAAIYTFWDGKEPRKLAVADYRNPFDPAQPLQPSLWATAVGRDGYYPLGLVNQCASNSKAILPNLSAGEPSLCTPPQSSLAASFIPAVFNHDGPTFPSHSWYVLCLAITILCLAHSLVLHTASFWSPITRDLAIKHSDEPRRRAVYIHIATAMLFSMSFITVWPVLPTLRLLKFSVITSATAIITIVFGFVAAIMTLRRTKGYISPAEPSRKRSRCRRPLSEEEKENLASEATLYPWFNLVALFTAVLVPVLWVYLCWNNRGPGVDSFVGLFFSYRCLYPVSGVSPLIPSLLLLFTWYVWAFLQTRRLRFSGNSRPMLPKYLPFLDLPTPLYISDDALLRCVRPLDSCLYANITCLLITRQIIRRFLPKWRSRVNVFLALAYSVLFAIFVFGLPIRSLDRFLRNSTLHLTPYEFLVSALFYPLLVIAITGCIRMLVIWSSLSQGLLEPLERSPLRFAFSRLTNVGWMTMLRQGGLLEYWRDMTRSTEAIRQMSHIDGISDAMVSHRPMTLRKAEISNKNLQKHIQELLKLVKGDRSQRWDACGNFLFGEDLPHPANRGELNLMCAIECDYATFAEALLAGVLVPYWLKNRCTPVEAETAPPATSAKEKHEATGSEEPRPSTTCGDPPHIRLAEEFLAIRYMSLIRSVLVNLRQLMIFVSAAFVLAMVAWNAYPFQPRQWIDWTFTGLLAFVGVVFVWVFAQMHRNPILSRITGTQVNELGSDFYIRLAAFGAVPILTWLGSQFPAIGSSIARLLQSGSGFAK